MSSNAPKLYGLKGDIIKAKQNIAFEKSNYDKIKFSYEQECKKLFTIAYKLTLAQDKETKKSLDKEYKAQYKVCADIFLKWGACFTRLHCNIDLLNDLLKKNK